MDKIQSEKVFRYANLAVASLVLVGLGMSESIFAPFFPTEAQRHGIGPITIGFIFGTFPMMMFFGSITSGVLIRKTGISFLIFTGTILAGGCLALFGLLHHCSSDTAYVILCFVLRFVEGIGASLYNTAVYSAMSVLFPGSISTVFAILETAVCSGMVAGPSFGGWLYNLGGFGMPFYFVGCFLLLFGTCSTILLKISRKRIKSESKENEQNCSTNGTHRPMNGIVQSLTLSVDFWILVTSMMIGSIVLQFPEPTLALYFETLGLSDPFYIGMIFLLSALGYTIFSLIIGRIVDSKPNAEPYVSESNIVYRTFSYSQ